MSKRRILIQLDSDPQPSTFDRVVAVDAGAEELFSYGNVTLDQVEGLVHGAMFTRGPQDLKHTAFFLGGGNVSAAEQMLERVRKTFFGPFRCSVLMDANGANTTASAAVLAARRHADLSNCRALVAGGTGPVGQRVGLLLARQGAEVWLASRTIERAQDACDNVRKKLEAAKVHPIEATGIANAGVGFEVVISAGAAGVRLLSKADLQSQTNLKVLIDLNAVPPAGIEDVEPGDNGRDSGGVILYGALGVGGTKMRIHKAAVARLFESNDQILDAEQVFDLGLELEG